MLPIEFKTRLFWVITFALAAICLCLSPLASAQQLAKRLILNDGSYKLTTKWERTGDRIRYYSAKQTIELKGEHAKVQSHVTIPALYVNTTQEKDTGDASRQPQQPQQPEQPIQLPVDRFKIVRMQAKQDKRIVGDIKIAVYGKVSQEQKLVPTTSQPISGGWVKVTPTSALTPGEYALVEMLGKEGMNLFVWDFGVNPTAPANPMASKPDPQIKEKPVELEKRDQH